MPSAMRMNALEVDRRGRERKNNELLRNRHLSIGHAAAQRWDGKLQFEDRDMEVGGGGYLTCAVQQENR